MKRKTLALISVGALLVVAVVLVPVQVAQATVTHSKQYSLSWTYQSPGLGRCITLDVSGTLNATTQAHKSMAGLTYYSVSRAWVSDPVTTLTSTLLPSGGCSKTPAPVTKAYFAQGWVDYSCSNPQDGAITRQHPCDGQGEPGYATPNLGTLSAQPPLGPGAELIRHASTSEFPLARTSTSLGAPTTMCFPVGAWAEVYVGNTSDAVSFTREFHTDKKVCLPL